MRELGRGCRLCRASVNDVGLLIQSRDKAPVRLCLWSSARLAVWTVKMSDHQTQSSSPENGDAKKVRPFRAKYRHLLDMGYKVKVNDDETLAVVDIPGPSYEAFDVDGNCRIWSLMRMMGAARYLAYHFPLDDKGHTFMDYGAMTDDIFTFMASSQFEVDKAMYDTHVPKWPLQVNAQLGHIGKSSTSSVSSLVVPSTGQVLAKNINQVVGIDKQTRKPTPLPTWWKEKFGEKAVRKEPLIVQKLSKPDGAHVCSRRVTWTETDMYKHVNWASYVIYSIDAMHHGMREGYLKNMNKDIVKNGLKTMRMAYFGECLEEDHLSVYFWEAEDQPRTVCFDVQRDGSTVFQNTMTYHDSD